MELADCPNCGFVIRFKTIPEMGDLVTCPKCNTELEVVWLDPIELDWPFEDDDEDFEDDYEEEYYDEDEYEDEEDDYFDDEDI